jgi:seryl-tRNA synthetase
MIDIKKLRSDTDEIKQSLANRKAEVNIDSIVEKDQQRRDLLFELDQLKQKRNENSSKIAKTKLEPEEKQLLIQETRSLGDQIKSGDVKLREIEEDLNSTMLTIPNILDGSTPKGESEDDNIEVRKWGEIPKFKFEPKHHADLAVELDILDFVRGVKLAHSRFTLVKKAGAQLERALINFMLDIHVNEHGFQEIMPPLLVNTKSMTGAGQLPKFEEDLFKTTEGLYLIPTSEVPLTNIHQDEILNEEDLPLYYTAYTPNFRSEAGSYGKDTKGYIRQHQFNKVEMVKFTHPHSSFEELEKLVSCAEVVLQRLELPYRVITLCSADIGFSAAKCYDLEVWIPSEDKYREISSCSNCTDFQARRANIRFKPTDGGKTQFVHTLNGSGVAVGRTVVAIIENYQQEDGTITVPKRLVPYMNGLTKIEA